MPAGALPNQAVLNFLSQQHHKLLSHFISHILANDDQPQTY